MQLKERVEGFFKPNHGSSNGEYVEIVQYFDPTKCEYNANKQEVLINIKLQEYKEELIKQNYVK